MAFQRGRARPLPIGLLCLPALLEVLSGWLFLHDDHWRNILVAALFCFLNLLLLHQAWGPGLASKRLTGRWIVIGGSFLSVLTMLVRTVFMALESDWDQVYRVPDQVQVWTYFIVLAILLINSMGFVLMQMEHAITQQHDLAIHDRLTGIYNRHALMEALEHFAAQSSRHHRPLALLMIDIDHFKHVNDRHGHPAGDEVLREVARRAQSRLRHSDLLARYGGEEFLAVLPDTDAEGARVAAEAIRQAIGQQPVRLPEAQVPITVSVGVHVSVAGSAAPDAIDGLISRSDQALYQAKKQGRDRVVIL